MANQYLFTDEQKDLQLMVRDFVNKEVIPHAAEWDREGEFPQDTFRKSCEMGLHLMGIPEEFGGMGLDQTTSWAAATRASPSPWGPICWAIPP